MTVLLLQIKVFFLLLAIFIVCIGIGHAILVFYFKEGKLFKNDEQIWLYLLSLSYILTMIICGL